MMMLLLRLRLKMIGKQLMMMKTMILDFEQFDFPKSKIKKSSAKKGKSGEDFDLDEDFRDLDLFNDGADTDDDEDDFQQQ